MKTVLFAWVHNAGRSQMAAAWFNQLADPAQAHALSAGTNPGPHVHPEVVTAMRAVGVNLADASTTKLTPELARQAQVLVTMGCGDECPYVPGAKRDDWPLEDPKGKPIDKFAESVTRSATAFASSSRRKGGEPGPDWSVSAVTSAPRSGRKVSAR